MLLRRRGRRIRTKVMLHGGIRGHMLIGIHGDRMKARQSHGIDGAVSMNGTILMQGGGRDWRCSNRHGDCRYSLDWIQRWLRLQS